MNQKSKALSRRKFLGDAAAISALGALGVGAVVSSCNRRPTYTAPTFLDQAPDGPVLRAGLVGCGGRGTGAAMNFLNAGPNLEIVAMGDVFQHRLDRCRNELRKKRKLSFLMKTVMLVSMLTKR
jgi:myo-inositol 2-dehydrogenase / D-chiro-inositol 1-dehydrogenase